MVALHECTIHQISRPMTSITIYLYSGIPTPKPVSTDPVCQRQTWVYFQCVISIMETTTSNTHSHGRVVTRTTSNKQQPPATIHLWQILLQTTEYHCKECTQIGEALQHCLTLNHCTKWRRLTSLILLLNTLLQEVTSLKSADQRLLVEHMAKNT